MTPDELQFFCRTFNVYIDETVKIPRFPDHFVFTGTEKPAAINATESNEDGVKLVISMRNLSRLVQMLDSKGYYHDEPYSIRMREEELIMEHPELKRLHDQYKTLLYMLSNN